MAKLNKNPILTRFHGWPLGTRSDCMTSVIKARKEHLVTMAGNRVNYPKARENKLPSRVRHFEKTKKKKITKKQFPFGGNALKQHNCLLFLDQLEQIPGKLRPALHGAVGLVCAPVC